MPFACAAADMASRVAAVVARSEVRTGLRSAEMIEHDVATDQRAAGERPGADQGPAEAGFAGTAGADDTDDPHGKKPVWSV